MNVYVRLKVDRLIRVLSCLRVTVVFTKYVSFDKMRCTCEFIVVL